MSIKLYLPRIDIMFLFRNDKSLPYQGPTLTDDLYYEILLRTDIKSVHEMSLASKLFNDIIQPEEFWEQKSLMEFPNNPKIVSTWKEHYVKLVKGEYPLKVYINGVFKGNQYPDMDFFTGKGYWIYNYNSHKIITHCCLIPTGGLDNFLIGFTTETDEMIDAYVCCSKPGFNNNLEKILHLSYDWRDKIKPGMIPTKMKLVFDPKMIHKLESLNVGFVKTLFFGRSPLVDDAYQSLLDLY